MITLFIGGHGRCDESITCTVPKNISIKWFGKQGNPVTKAYSSAVLNGDHQIMSGLSSSDYPPCEHFCCESLAVENEERAKAFQKGRWNKNTYLVQAKPDFFVPLSKIMAYAQQKWSGQKIEIKWAVCRSSVNYSGIIKHDFQANQALEVNRDSTAPSQSPPQVVGNADGAIFVEKWNGVMSFTNYGGVSEKQLKKVTGAKKFGVFHEY